MCISRSERFDALSVALSARIAIDTILGFYEGEKLWHNAEEGIRTIEEVRRILRRLYQIDETDVRIWNLDVKRFENYDQMLMLKEAVERTEWTTWDKDLEQWLKNKDKVLDYFTCLEGWAIHKHRHG